MRKKDEKKLEAIKKTVIELTKDYGFHGISMSKIAKEGGVSPATIYTYYENKSEMIHQIYHDVRMDRYSFVHRNVKNDMSAKDVLKTVYKSYYKYIISHKDEFYFIKQFSSCPCLYYEMEAKQYNTKFEEMLDKFKEDKQIKHINNKVIYSMLHAPIDSIVEDYFIRGSNDITEEEIDNMFELVWDVIKFK